MKKSKAQSKRSTYTPDPQLIYEVQRVLRGRIFHGDVPVELHGLDEQKRFVCSIWLALKPYALSMTITQTNANLSFRAETIISRVFKIFYSNSSFRAHLFMFIHDFTT